MKNYITALAALTAASVATPALACSSCGCTLAADWLTDGLNNQPGTVVTLRYDFVPQSRLITGTTNVSRADYAPPNDREIENYTYNHFATLGINHNFDSHWAVDVAVPYIDRAHSTVSPTTTDASFSNTHGLGDVRVTGRYQWNDSSGVTGLSLGAKLPTGAFHQNFSAGPSTGDAVDRDLQPGLGTTSILVGAYRTGRLAKNLSYIAQVEGDIALNARDSFRPGSSIKASVGVQYTGWAQVTPQLHFNLRSAALDAGVNADPDNSGGTQLYVAPGVRVPLSARAGVFVVGQLPLVQRVHGFQLVPRATISAGLHWRL